MKSELLAPAGTLEALKTALYFGADAVYCGGPMLQLRAESATFSFDDIKTAASLCHEKGKKLYVTVNCFAENGEIKKLKDYAERLKAAGADALIVSDLGAIAELREKCPDMDIHVSTQANTQNYRTINFYRDMGVKRVVLGREMPLEQIEELKGLIYDDIELEAFVHGAMCMAYSGRCLLSSFLTNRSGNRGECSQPCRWNYYLVEEKRANLHIPVTQDGNATAILSSHDLKCISFLDRLENAGISSFKIEGRMKSPYYIATVVNAYRRFMDGNAPLDICEEELNCASHRPYSSGFYFGETKNDPNNDGLYRRTCDFVGIVLEKAGKDEYIVEMRNRFSVGDELEILSPNSLQKSFKVELIKGENGENKQSAALVQEKVTVNCPYELQNGDILRKRIM